ncbi:hypothetical protein X975_06333, partial [Stegodyphus mimosarum]
MHNLAGNHFSDDLLQSLWLSCLPNNTQIILAAFNEDLTRLAAMADKINELVTPAYVSAANAIPSSSSLEQQVVELTKKVSELSTSLHASR